MDIKLVQKLYEEDLFPNAAPEEVEKRSKVVYPYLVNNVEILAHQLNYSVFGGTTGGGRRVLTVYLKVNNDEVRIGLEFGKSPTEKRCKFNRVGNLQSGLASRQELEEYIGKLHEAVEFLDTLDKWSTVDGQ